MNVKEFISLFLIFLSLNSFSQEDVRAWYADGQVFVVWKIGLPLEETFAIYASPSAFTHTSNATLVGRPFAFEYLGFALKDNLKDTTATYRIPNGQGGLYQLALNEGLFVFTPHQSGSLYFAVTSWGSSTVTPGQNITETAVPFNYDPVSDPVECHLQRTFPSPFTTGYVCFAYVMWADGRQNHWEGRPDFPIMAHAAKNGMPGLFLVSAPVNIDTTEAFPLSVWLHGAGGNARQSLAGSRKVVNIDPEQGILVAHDDKMYGIRGNTRPHPDQPSWHFGWGKNYDPFTPNIVPEMDTIINFTQRRYLWIDDWLARQFHIDTHRINIHGHSMGSAGAIALVKSFPEHYASATIFNTGCAGPEDNSNTSFIFGTKNDNFPTTLMNREGQIVRFYDLWDMYTNCSPERDLPIIRHWHGKNDDNGTMRWSPAVVRNYIICDSLGTGAQNHWSERPHGIDQAPDYNDHWIKGNLPRQQTALDDVVFAETHFRNDQSFPAFFNHRADPKNNHPGVGLIGINNGDGDNWGTWGGYHRWENVSETSGYWEVTVWLEDEAVFSHDNSPATFLTADLAIRRPQAFNPTFGEEISWTVKDLSSNQILQSGSAIVQSDDVVVIPQIEVFQKNIRKILITVTSGSTSVENEDTQNSIIHIYPNPAGDIIFTNPDWDKALLLDMNGKEIKSINVPVEEQTLDVSYLTGGIYYIVVSMKDGTKRTGKFFKL